MIDIWPEDLATGVARSPVTILKEQAALLGQKTRNIVVARIHKFDQFTAVFPRVAPNLYRSGQEVQAQTQPRAQPEGKPL